MKLAILSRDSRLYSTRRLVEAARERGHRVRVIDTLKCYMDIASAHPTVRYQGKKLNGFDAVIPRIGASITHYGMAVIRQFEMMQVYCLTGSVALSRSRDKFCTLQLLAQVGMQLPQTAFGRDIEDSRELISLVGGAPLIVKLLEGTQGRGVVLAETTQAAESVIGAFRELKADFLVQEFVRDVGGSDLRCLVVGDHVVASMERTAAAGEFRANLHRGGSARATDLSEDERTAALKAARTLGLSVAGVDILRSPRGPLVLEVNSSPGLEGIERACAVDVAAKIIGHIEHTHRI
jgi:ribosomal protein S6--L-glutamate ligase